MLKCPLWFRMVDGCFSLVLWEVCICSCLFVFVMFLDLEVVECCLAGVTFCIGALFAWCCRDFHIVVSMRVELLRRSI